MWQEVSEVTAQPVDSASRRPWSPDPLRQRLANYTIEDVLILPDDAPRVELRDGVIILVPSPSFGHQKISHRLWRWFEDHAPREFEPSGATGVVVGLVGDRYELVADSAEELVLAKPFEVRLRVRDIAP